MKNVPVMRGICFKEPLNMDLLEINMGPGFRSTSGLIQKALHLMQDKVCPDDYPQSVSSQRQGWHYMHSLSPISITVLGPEKVLRQSALN